MRSASAITLLLLAGCTWSNSLYQAKVNSAAALRAEREGRPGDAENAWGIAAGKAELAYARHPEGEQAAEALWLRGRALARRRDCSNAAPLLERSAVLRRNAPWREPLVYELAFCRELMQDRGSAALFEELATSRDTALRQLARRRAGEALVRDERWSEALNYLGQADDARSRVNRATALAALDRPAEALVELRAVLAAPDTAIDYLPLLRLEAARNNNWTDSVLALLVASPLSTPERHSRWLLAAVRGAEPTDPAAMDRYLARLLLLPGSPSVSEGALLATDRIVAHAISPADLRFRFDSLARVADEGLPRRRADQLRGIATALMDEESATVAGSPAGDLVLFVLAESARDSLAAPRLAGWLFGRIERDWPQSPYVGKSLLARLPLLPDSGDALRARLGALPPGNPYVAYLQGAQDARFVALEDSLRHFLIDRARAASGRRAASGAGVQPR
ncbi:MAG: hypothetical protein ABIZ70_06000 [Gemmatimonadales bacterium]